MNGSVRIRERHFFLALIALLWLGEIAACQERVGSVVAAPGGQIVYRELGSIDPLALKRAIVKALNEKQPW